MLIPFPNFNGAAVEVWEWISNFIPHFTWHVRTYPCWDWNCTMLVKGTPGHQQQWYWPSLPNNLRPSVALTLGINLGQGPVCLMPLAVNTCSCLTAYHSYREKKAGLKLPPCLTPHQKLDTFPVGCGSCLLCRWCGQVYWFMMCLANSTVRWCPVPWWQPAVWINTLVSRIENNVCTWVTNCFSIHESVILVFISWVVKQQGI